MRIQRYICTSALIILLACHQTLLAAEALQRETENDPVTSLQITFDKIRHFQNSELAHNLAAQQVFITTELMSQFTFDTMLRWIAGPFARYMTAAEKAGMIRQLSADINTTLTRHFLHFNLNHSRIRIHKPRYTGPVKATVVVQVYSDQKHTLNLSFHLQLTDQHWKIVDIGSFGTSLTMFYRARYIDQLRSFRHLSARSP